MAKEARAAPLDEWKQAEYNLCAAHAGLMYREGSENEMSFQAYLDKVEELTGKTPDEFVEMARAKNLTKHGDILAWLKSDYGLGTGHARAIAHVILKGPEFEVRQTTAPHRDESGTLITSGLKNRKQ